MLSVVANDEQAEEGAQPHSSSGSQPSSVPALAPQLTKGPSGFEPVRFTLTKYM